MLASAKAIGMLRVGGRQWLQRRPSEAEAKAKDEAEKRARTEKWQHWAAPSSKQQKKSEQQSPQPAVDSDAGGSSTEPPNVQ